MCVEMNCLLQERLEKRLGGDKVAQCRACRRPTDVIQFSWDGWSFLLGQQELIQVLALFELSGARHHVHADVDGPLICTGDT